MIWLPTVILAGVVLVVGWVYLGAKLGGREPALEPLLLIAVVLYCTSLTVAWFFTYFSSPGANDWWVWLAVRVAWIALGLGLIVFASVREAGQVDRRLGALLGVFALLSIWAAKSCALDLVAGPVPLVVTGLAVQNVSGGARGGARIFATLQVKRLDGRATTFDLAGWGATLAQDAVDECAADTQPVLLVLAHTEKVLDVDCRAPAAR